MKTESACFSFITALLLITAGCSSTKVIESVKAADENQLDFAGKKIIALVIHPEAKVQAEAEAALAQEITKRGMVGLTASSFIPAADMNNREQVKAVLKSSGAEAVVISRLKGIEQTTQYVSTFDEPYYGSLMGYYDYGHGITFSPGYIQTFDTFVIETLCYRIPDEKLLWSGTSETFAPNSVKSLAKELVKEAGKVMRKQGLLVKK